MRLRPSARPAPGLCGCVLGTTAMSLCCREALSCAHLFAGGLARSDYKKVTKTERFQLPVQLNNLQRGAHSKAVCVSRNTGTTR